MYRKALETTSVGKLSKLKKGEGDERERVKGGRMQEGESSKKDAVEREGKEKGNNRSTRKGGVWWKVRAPDTVSYGEVR